MSPNKTLNGDVHKGPLITVSVLNEPLRATLPSFLWTAALSTLTLWQQSSRNMGIWRTITSRFSLYASLSSRTSAPSRFFSSRIVDPSCQRIGFIGLGNMGAHMANNLIKAGYQLTVSDINHDAMQKFLEKGATTKETPREVAELSDIVITMLPSSSNVIDVYKGPNGLLHGGESRPWLFIDSSTIDPQTSRQISLDVSKHTLESSKGIICSSTLLDAPVSGGVLGAEAAKLTFMVGGLEEAFMASMPLFLSMGKHAIYCGGAGNGAAAKICNNLAMAVSMLGVSEALALGQRLGITAKTLTSIFNSSSARCWSSDSYNPVPGVMTGVPSSRNYQGGFSSKLMAKDLALAVSSMKEVDLKCHLALETENIYNHLCKSGHEIEDFSCAFRHIYTGKDEIF